MSLPIDEPAKALGRPVVTSHAAIEAVAFALFAERGFEGTTVEAIAAECGIGRRTLFRYYESKNDIPWGQFDRSLEDFRELLASMPDDLPLYDAVRDGILRFNDFDLDAEPSHRDRMRLIITTPALQAHSVLRYAAWREVIAEFAARRLDSTSDDLLPSLLGHVSLAMALAAYEAWLADETASLPALVMAATDGLRALLDGDLEASGPRV